MTPVRRYDTRHGERWMATACYGYTQRQKRGFLTRKEARAWELETIRELQERTCAGGAYLSKAPTLEEYARTWLGRASSRVRPSTLEDYRYVLDLHILPTFGGQRMDDIKRADLQGLLDTKTPNLYRKCRVLLRAVYRQAIDDGVVIRDPTDGLKPPPLRRPTIRYLTRDEVMRLLEVAEGTNRMIILLGVQTGMRAGEMAALRWADINPRYIAVSRSIRRGREGSTKTGRQRRVFIGSALYRELMAFRGDAGDDDYVLRQSSGKPLDAGLITKRLSRLGEKAGIGHLHSHVLRHTYAAWMLSEGHSPQLLREQLGHSTIRTTFDAYGHLVEDVHSRYREWADDYFSSL